MNRDLVTDIGLAVVGAAAAILTFTSLTALAEQVGINGTVELAGYTLRASWLIPVTVDAAGVVAARVWLKRIGTTEAVRFARALAMSCIGASVAGNAGQHGMAAYDVTAPWWVVVLVSAVPPAMLGAVVHLGHLLAPAWEPVQDTSPAPVAEQPTGVTTAEAPGQIPEQTPVNQPERTDEEIMDELRLMLARDGKLPGRDAVRKTFGIGSKRADRVRNAVLTEPAPEQIGGGHHHTVNGKVLR